MDNASLSKDPGLTQRHRVNFNIVTLPEGIIKFSATPKLFEYRRRKREQKSWPTTRMPRRIISQQEISDISGMMTKLDVGTVDASSNQSLDVTEAELLLDIPRPVTSRRRRLKAVRKIDMKCESSYTPSTPGNTKQKTLRYVFSSRSKETSSSPLFTQESPGQTEVKTTYTNKPTFTFSVPKTRNAVPELTAQTTIDQSHKKWHGLWQLPFVPATKDEVDTVRGSTVITRCRYQCVASMDEYEHKSLEEMRVEDYMFGGCFSKSKSHYGPKFKTRFTSETVTTKGISRLLQGNVQCISAMREYHDRSFEELRMEHYAPSLGWKDRDRYSLSREELTDLPIALDSDVFFYRESRKKGKVRFIGRLPGKSERDVYVGIELADSSGLGNGCYGGIRLFRTEDFHAEFVPLDSALPGYLVDIEEEKVNLPVLDESPSSSSASGGNKCAVCWTNDVQIFFQPCGHVCCCERCSKSMKDCPVCRKPIRQKLRAFLT